MTVSKQRRALAIGGVAVAAAIAGAGAALWRRERSTADDIGMLDRDFWSRGFDRPDGGRVELAAFRGRPLVLNFWATWCPPCVEELPMIDRFFVDHAANGWQVVGLAVDQRAQVDKFLARTPVSFPIGITGFAGTDLMKRLGNTAGGLPFTLVVSAKGDALARKMGKLDLADLDAWRRAQLHS